MTFDEKIEYKKLLDAASRRKLKNYESDRLNYLSQLNTWSNRRTHIWDINKLKQMRNEQTK